MKHYIDFDDLLIRTSQEIEKQNGECPVNLAGHGKGLPVILNSLRYLLIDEFQDYSELFHTIVSSMKKSNPSLCVIAVGDDWQAINSFAGSNLNYFTHFENYFPEAKEYELLTNYRSGKEIIEFGNNVMDGYGTPVAVQPNQGNSSIELNFIDDIWLNIPQNTNADPDRRDDTQFLFNKPHGEPDMGSRILVSQYLSACHDIIIESGESSVLILSRGNFLPFGLTLNDFSQKLIDRQNEIDKILRQYLAIEKTNFSIVEWMLLGKVRELLGLYFGSTIKSVATVDVSQLFSRTINEAKNRVKKWNGRLYFVYLPEYARYTTKVDHNLFRKKSKVIDLVRSFNIPVIDIHKEVFIEHDDPISMFPLRINGHYNSKGYANIAKAIALNIKNYED